MKKVIGYLRVSTQKQADSGLSLDAQKAKISAMAVVMGVEISEFIIDAGESAGSINRPGLTGLLSMVAANQVETVVIAKLDRLTRSVKDLGTLIEIFERRGVNLVSVADSLDTRSAAGRLVLNIMTSVAQWEREAIGERTKDALQAKKAKGERTGNIPFGFQIGDGAQLVENELEQSIIRRIHSLRQEGLSLRQIAAALNADGQKTRSGGDWKHEYVNSILKAA